MPICQITGFLPATFVATWSVAASMAGIFLCLTSGQCFNWLYRDATYKKWQHKSSGVYPSAGYVRKEVIQTMKGVIFATCLPALSLYMRRDMKGYCVGDETMAGGADQDLFERTLGLDRNDSWLRVGLEFAIIVGVTDFVEFFYHWCGHYFDLGWEVHRHHHHFSNPTPWAVIADEPTDNIVRACPLFFLPYFLPLNLNTLFLTFAVFFYMYGIYLHCGYEADWIIPSDHWFVNTSFQHYVHHAKGTRSKPIHCGFFVKLWDQIWRTEYDGPECFARSERAKGKRSVDKWNNDVIRTFPNYSLLSEWRFYVYGEKHEMFKDRLVVDKSAELKQVAEEKTKDSKVDEKAEKEDANNLDAERVAELNGTNNLDAKRVAELNGTKNFDTERLADLNGENNGTKKELNGMNNLDTERVVELNGTNNLDTERAAEMNGANNLVG